MDVLKAKPCILEVINAVAEDEGMQNYWIENMETNQKGEGYLSEIFLVKILDKNGAKLEIIVKSAFTKEAIRAAIPIQMCFLNEIYFYNSIYPKLETMLKTEEKFIPKCFKVLTNSKIEILCLENLKASGFEMFNKQIELDHDHIKLIFEKYGRFHALGFAFKIENFKEFFSFGNKLENVFQSLLTGSKSRFAESINKTFNAMNEHFEESKNYTVLENLEKYSNGGAAKIFSEMITKKNRFPTLLHGDCWSNNMMFKYEQSGASQKLKDMCLLDFQLARIGSPVFDLSYCLYSGASQKVYESFQTYLKIYHKTLCSALKLLGHDVEKVYPFSALEEDWREYSKFGMMMGAMVIKIKVADQADLKDMADIVEANDEDVKRFKIDEVEYNKRIMNLITHMCNINAL